MGQHVSNSGMRGHGKGATPATAELELWLHWGDKGLDEATTLSTSQAEWLIQAAQVGQGQFDAVAGGLAPWYALTGLTGPERAKARESCRLGVLVFAGLST